MHALSSRRTRTLTCCQYYYNDAVRVPIATSVYTLVRSIATARSVGSRNECCTSVTPDARLSTQDQLRLMSVRFQSAACLPLVISQSTSIPITTSPARIATLQLRSTTDVCGLVLQLSRVPWYVSPSVRPLTRPTLVVRPPHRTNRLHASRLACAHITI